MDPRHQPRTLHSALPIKVPMKRAPTRHRPSATRPTTSDHERIPDPRNTKNQPALPISTASYLLTIPAKAYPGFPIHAAYEHNMNSHHSGSRTTPSQSRTSTPSPPSLSSSWSVPMTVSHAVTGLLRRFSTEPSPSQKTLSPLNSPGFKQDGVYTPPYRTASPFQPPPLYPLSLGGYKEGTPASARLLNKALAEEIRLLIPPRLQLCDEWNLVYSLEEHGVSLGTLYKKCGDLRGLRNGFVLVVKDGEGGLFGAYLSEAPHVSPHYFGTGECFLWRASQLSPTSLPTNLPPPPSTDTTNLTRNTTISSDPLLHNAAHLSPALPSSSTFQSSHTPPPPLSPASSLRFKAFPYSGVNDYMMLCDANFLSVGGGDGHYGLWLDDSFERGISSSCLTFGNERLSEEGEKFDILGVEVWSIGNRA